MTLKFRLATPSEAQACNDFQQRWLKHPRTARQWLWEFAPQENTKSILYGLALDGDDIVGTQALIRIPMRGPLGTMATAKGEDTLIHPKYWGKEILRPLWDLLFENADNEGIRLVWGFNSRRPVFQKFGFRYLDDDSSVSLLRPLSAAGMRRVALVDSHGNPKRTRNASWRHRLAASGVAGSLATAASAGLAAFGSLGQGRRTQVTVSTLALVDDRFDSFLDRFVQRTQSITVNRSTAFLRWRLVKNPWAPSRLLGAVDPGGELVGIIAFAMSMHSIATITDLIVCDRDHHGVEAAEASTIFHLLRHATAELARSGAQIVQLQVVNMHASADMTIRAAKRLGYFAKPGRVGACIRPLGKLTIDNDMLNHRRWHFTNINTEGRAG